MKILVIRSIIESRCPRLQSLLPVLKSSLLSSVSLLSACEETDGVNEGKTDNEGIKLGDIFRIEDGTDVASSIPYGINEGKMDKKGIKLGDIFGIEDGMDVASSIPDGINEQNTLTLTTVIILGIDRKTTTGEGLTRLFIQCIALTRTIIHNQFLCHCPQIFVS